MSKLQAGDVLLAADLKRLSRSQELASVVHGYPENQLLRPARSLRGQEYSGRSQSHLKVKEARIEIEYAATVLRSSVVDDRAMVEVHDRVGFSFCRGTECSPDTATIPSGTIGADRRTGNRCVRRIREKHAATRVRLIFRYCAVRDDHARLRVHENPAALDRKIQSNTDSAVAGADCGFNRSEYEPLHLEQFHRHRQAGVTLKLRGGLMKSVGEGGRIFDIQNGSWRATRSGFTCHAQPVSPSMAGTAFLRAPASLPEPESSRPTTFWTSAAFAHGELPPKS
jgi:hypothetical protein